MTERIPDEEQESTSKSARKRAAAAIQAVCKRIAALPTEQRRTLELPAEIADAIEDYLRFPSHEAKRRQLQFIAKLMRKVDTAQVESALDKLAGTSAEARYAFHQVEVWRDRLLDDPQALGQLMHEYPGIDGQALRHAIRKVTSAKTEQQRKVQARGLFRLLREEIG